jgi:asparagine synthase (glutamine-hydrolysing)
MCGIAGFMRVSAGARGITSEQLMVLRDGMARRGPDDAGLWMDTSGDVGLAHRRLSIIDLTAAGHQPMEDPESGNQIVFNGEIYNFRTLADELRAAGVRLRTNSDTEVILALYRREGVAMLRKLRGMFAFAIWDARERALVLARDPYGVKPLYYAEVEGTLVFASQVRALRRLPELHASPPLPAAKVAFLLFGYVPEPITFFTDIACVPAGSWLRANARGVGTSVGYASVTEPLQRTSSPDAAKHNIPTALGDSIRHHMVADVPVGVFLSAGRDSAVIAAAASRCVSEPLRTVTLSFEEFAGTPFDEAPLAEATARALGTEHRTVQVRRADFEQEFDRILDAMDQPTIDGINVYFVSKAAAACGLKVALSGLGADELFGGYAHFRSIPRMVSLCRPFGRLNGVGRSLRRLTAPLIAGFASPKYAGMVEYGARIGDAYLLSRALFAPWELADLLDPDEAETGLSTLAERTGFAAIDDWPGAEHAQLVALESTWYMRNQLLRDADWASMAHSLEVRVPFVDHVLLEALAPLIAGESPPGKADMLAPFQSQLPPSVAERGKTGFGIPVHRWLAQAHPTRDGPAARKRGLRPWAMHVYDHFLRHV